MNNVYSLLSLYIFTEYTVPLVLVKTMLFKNSDCFIIKKNSTRKPIVLVKTFAIRKVLMEQLVLFATLEKSSMKGKRKRGANNNKMNVEIMNDEL